jgi:hypothetical protein
MTQNKEVEEALYVRSVTMALEIKFEWSAM